MKVSVLKALTLIMTGLFFGCVFYLSGIPLVRLWDFPTASGLIVGTALLSALGHRKNNTTKRREKIAFVSLIVTSLCFLMIGIMGSFVYADDVTDLILLFSIAFLTIPYSLIIAIIIKAYYHHVENKAAFNKSEVPSDNTNLDQSVDSLQIDIQIDPAWQLTPREIEIVTQLSQGLTNREIGEILFISEATVKRHLANVFSKSGISNRQALTVYLHQKV